jgi:thermitase
MLVSLFFTSGWKFPNKAFSTVPESAVDVNFLPGEILVRLKPGFTNVYSLALQQHLNASRIRTLYQSTIELWRVPVGHEQEVLDELMHDRGVDKASLNHRLTIGEVTLVPNDTNYSKQWGLNRILAAGAWDISTGSTSMVVAILDTGVDETHPDLSPKMIAGYDFSNNDALPHDEHGHGTHVAGIAAAATNNGLGIAGLDWNARIMPVQVIASNGWGSDSDAIEGINYASSHGARVINMSFGGGGSNALFQDAVNSAWANGVVLIASAGNDDNDVFNYPAAYEHVIAVTASTKGDAKADFSNYGSYIDLAAPGVDILSTVPNNKYEYYSGTSMAAPFVTGLASLIYGRVPGLTPTEVETALKDTADDILNPGWDQYSGYGRINAQAALALYKSPTTPTLSAILNPEFAPTYLVDWNNTANALSYTLQVDDQMDFSSPDEIYTGSETQFQVVNQPGGTWYYRVRANGEYDLSAWSNSVSTGVLPWSPGLNSISNPSQTDHYTILWTSIQGAEWYILEEDDNINFTSPITRYSGRLTSYPVTGQTGGTWYYRVNAGNIYGSGNWSAIQSTQVIASSLSFPTLSAIDNPEKDGNYLIQWSTVISATQYILEESNSPYFENPLGIYTGVDTQLTISNHPSGTWYYRVRAVADTDQSPWSEAIFTVITDWVFMPVILK